MAIGKFSISPKSERTDDGAYQACVTVSSGQGQGTHHRVSRLSRCFASPDAAHMVALTHGWLQTFGSRALPC